MVPFSRPFALASTAYLVSEVAFFLVFARHSAVTNIFTVCIWAKHFMLGLCYDALCERFMLANQ
jgi:hypothetical protein